MLCVYFAVPDFIFFSLFKLFFAIRMTSDYFLKTKADVFICVLQGHPENDNVAKFMPEIVSCCTAAAPHGLTLLDAFSGAVLPVCPPSLSVRRVF